ncbi:MAG TPA: hypothetical protein VMH83_08120 [Candidatus Acidoferrum sp.]|nr:hypothetical protein [Candidatus Acidoferrum sp.]
MKIANLNKIVAAVLLLSGLGSVAHAQYVADPGFKSVGRGAPLKAVIPSVSLPPFGQQTSPDAEKAMLAFMNNPTWVGPMAFGMPQNTDPAHWQPPLLNVAGAWNGAVPAGVKALPVDLFTSKDFYKDKALWLDKRYFRCNSPEGLEMQYGAIFGATIGSNPPRSAAWGYCDRDYPREAIVSPYGFKTAQDHYEALMAETKKRGGPTKHTYATVPGELNGRYLPANPFENWYSLMLSVQFATVMSLLTPEYQQRLVQDAYHQANTNAPQWPSQYCWPEGFMRRWYAWAIQFPQSVIVTPSLVQFMSGVADNFVTNIHIGREFRMDGPVPRLGANVPRWYGETIGFWDHDALITWTSNIQPWTAHGAFEFSGKMQSIEIYTPVRDKSGNVTSLNHEAVFYDPEALVDPIRIVTNYKRLGGFEDGAPIEYIRCNPTIYPVKGHATAVRPGQVIEYEVPDMFGRPWAQIVEKYFEQGMEKPKDADDALFDFGGSDKK